MLAVVGLLISGIALGQAQNGWDNELSQKLGVTLLQQFDSSGPAVWDVEAHPTVFITTEGPGYGGLLSGVKLPGVAIFDAVTREVVASQAFDLGWSDVFEPHGLGVSPDGKWIYLPTGNGRSQGRFLIINALTLKVDKVLGLRGRPHHAESFRSADGRDLVVAYGWDQPMFVMDPLDDNRVVGGTDFNDQGMEGYLYFPDPSGEHIYAGGRWRNSAARSHLDSNVVMVINTKDWSLERYIPIEDANPVWISFSADGRYAYITGAETSTIFKYDTEAQEIVGHTRAGVEGPYGTVLNWEDTELYTVGKGESSHNRGKVLGLINTGLMEKSTRPVDQYTTNCIRGDHATLNPDPDADEIWITCNSSFEIVVFDLDLKEVTARIPMPHGGSTHSGAFVQYQMDDMGDVVGEVLSDQDGLHGSAMQIKRAIQGLAAR